MSQQLVQKLWNYCNILRNDGLSYGDYVEQLMFLLFLKMADEQARPPFNKLSPIPRGKTDLLLTLLVAGSAHVLFLHQLSLRKGPDKRPHQLNRIFPA